MPMRSSQAARMLGLVLVCGSILTSGCSHFAMVRAWEPASIEVADIERLAIADFQGDLSGAVGASLEARLWDGRFYSLVDPAELESAQHAACPSLPTEEVVLALARDRGVDAVIFGEVREFHCDDHPVEVESDRSADEDANAGDMAASREAVVAVTFRLLDTRTGEVRAAKDTSHRFQAQSGTGRPALPERDEVLAKLTKMCVNDFVEMLAPHQVERPIELASGGWYRRQAAEVRNGNRLAARGDWDAARDHWQSAVDQNGECDAALFNLAIDAAHRQQYARAEEPAMQAIRIRHMDRYAEGLERIRSYRNGYDAVQQQRDRRVLQASASSRP
jgi:hypothetical protein